MDRLYVGLDVGSTTCHLVAMNAEGGVVVDRKIGTSEGTLIQAFSELQGEVHVHIETCELAAWVRRILKPRVTRVVVGHSKTNAWIAKDPQKSDRVDATKLAELLRMGRVHEVYYSDDEGRLVFKQVVQQYEDVSNQAGRLKVRIKSRFRQQGVIVRGSSVYGQKSRLEWLNRLESPQIRQAIECLYEVLDQTVESGKKVEKLMVQMGRRYSEIALLDSAPGIGQVLACRYSAYVQDPRRFHSARALLRYSGLAVTHPSSDGKQLAHECLDRWSGNPKMKDISRKAFLGAMRCTKENVFQRAFKASLNRTHDRTHARLNVQRKIVVTLRAIWMGGEEFKDDMGEAR